MLGDDEGAGFLSQLQKYGKVRLVKGDDFTTIVNQLEGIEALIIGFHRSDATPYKNEKFSTDEVALITLWHRKFLWFLMYLLSPIP